MAGQTELTNLANDLKDNIDQIRGYDEARTKQEIIQQVLFLLGWNPFTELIPEFIIGDGRVDYALQRETLLALLEAKRVGEDLSKHQNQLLLYAVQAGTELAILTDGIAWWLYLPHTQGSWEQRKFFVVDLIQQDSIAAAENLIRFLEASRVASGEAIRSAEQYRQSKQSQEILRKTLPKAWNKLVTTPEEILVDLLIEQAESMCGYKASQELAESFLALHAPNMLIPESGEIRPRKGKSKAHSTERPQPPRVRSETQYTGTQIVSFTLGENTYPVSSYIEMLFHICSILYHEDPLLFEEVALSLRGRKRPYFTRDPNELRTPKELENTQIYVEANLSTQSIVLRCRSLLALFNYPPEMLTIEKIDLSER